MMGKKMVKFKPSSDYFLCKITHIIVKKSSDKMELVMSYIIT